MREESNHPAFDVRCPKCNAAPGKYCSRWEGCPVFCVERGDMARQIFGKGSEYKALDGKTYKV